MDQIDYKKKYLKYKKKYLELKGGNKKEIKEIKKKIEKELEKKDLKFTSQDDINSNTELKIKKIFKNINEKKKYFDIIDKLLCRDNIIDFIKSKKNDKNLLILKRILKTFYIELNNINKLFIDTYRCSFNIFLELVSTKISNAIRELKKWKNKMENKLNEINNEIEFNKDEIEILTFDELTENIDKII